MVNGPGEARKVDLAHLATIRQILTAARDPKSLRTKELPHLSRKGDSPEIRTTASEIERIIISSVKVGELDFTAVASRGAELLQEVEAKLAQAIAAREETERELQSASGRITQIEEARATAVAKLGETEAQLAKVTGERVDVSKEWSAAQAKVQQKLEEIAGLEKRITEIDEARQAAIRHQDELKRQTDEAVGKQRELQGQVDDLKLRIGDAERIRGERIAKERDLLRLRGQVGELERVASQAREELEQLRNDPEIAGMRSQNTELGRLLGEREAKLAEAAAHVTQYEGALAEKEFEHTHKSGEMGEIVRIRTAEKEAALAELATARTELERFRQWADFGVRTYNETLPGLAQQIQRYQESEAAMVLAHQHFATQKEEEIALMRSTPRKLPPALTLLAELKDKNPKAYQFIVNTLITIATRYSEEAQNVSPPIATIGQIVQKTLRSPEVTQAVELDEFQNRAIIATDTVARTIEIIEKDNKRVPGAPSSARLLNRLHRFFASPETSLDEMKAMVEFLAKIVKTPALVPTLMKQIEEIEASQVECHVEENRSRALLAEIKYLADPANENEYMIRSQRLYAKRVEELEALLNDPSTDDTTRETITKIMADASQAAEQTISFEEEPTQPEGKPKGLGSKIKGWFSRKPQGE